MAPDRGTELYRCGVLPLTTAFTRHSLEPCGSKASQSYTVRLRGRREGRREREKNVRRKLFGRDVLLTVKKIIIKY